MQAAPCVLTVRASRHHNRMGSPNGRSSSLCFPSGKLIRGRSASPRPSGTAAVFVGAGVKLNRGSTEHNNHAGSYRAEKERFYLHVGSSKCCLSLLQPGCVAVVRRVAFTAVVKKKYLYIYIDILRCCL